jgi:hypothetical protein
MNKKYLIIQPKNGLCNQLYSISRGVVLGLISKRDVIFKSFQLDYKNIENTCPFDAIINIDHIQNKLNEKNININIISNFKINGTKIITDLDIEIHNIKNLIQYLLDDNNINEKYLDIECPISCEIPYEYRTLLKYIDLNIKFTDKYINIAKNIKSLLKIDYYCCIHLRLENDAISFMKELNPLLTDEYINNFYKAKYIEHLNILKEYNINIYICSSLGISNNINNDFYKEIKKKYNLIDKNDIITVTENNCREIYGIIDFIIAQDSLYFVGCDWSSFSYYIYSSHKDNKKNCHLLDLWETLKDVKKIE